MKSLRQLSLATFLLAIVLATIQPASARLGDDRDALEKRFGKGQPFQQDEQLDGGLWELFDEVLFFEKSGLHIVAGISDGKCLAIVYQVPPAKDDPSEKDQISWTEAQTLVAKNAGENPITRKSMYGSRHDWRIGDDFAFARLEAHKSSSGEFTRISIFSNDLFSSYETFQSADVRSEFLKKNPPKDLSDF